MTPAVRTPSPSAAQTPSSVLFMPTGARVHAPQVPVDTTAETNTDETGANHAIPDLCLCNSEQAEPRGSPFTRRREDSRMTGCLCGNLAFPGVGIVPRIPTSGAWPRLRGIPSAGCCLGTPADASPCAVPFDPTHDEKTPPKYHAPANCTLGPQPCVRVTSLPPRERPRRPLRVIATGIQFYRMPQNRLSLSVFIRTRRDSRSGRPDRQD